MRSPLSNPVLRRELRERMRSPSTPWVVGGHLLALVVLFWLVYRAQSDGTVDDPAQLARLGRSVFDWVLAALLLLVVFLVPGLAAGAVAGERERQTLVPLQSSLLGARRIVAGKVSASLALLLLLVVVALPVLVLTWVLGGAGIHQALAGLGVVAAAGVTLTCVAVGCSAATRRVQTATVAAYVVTLALVGGTLGLYEVLDEGVVGDADAPSPFVLATNPLAVLAAATAPPAASPAAQADSALTPVRAAVSPLRSGVRVVECPTAPGEVAPNGCPAPTTDTAQQVRGVGPVLPVMGGPAPPFEGAAEPVEVVVAEGGYASFLALAAGLAAALSVAGVGFATLRLRVPAEVER